MIKINLLPVRAAKKKEAVQRHAVLFGFGLAALLAVAAGAFVVESSRLSEVEEQNKQLKTEIEDLKKILGEIAIYKEKEALLQKQLEIIKKLRANKTGPVHMLDEISTHTPEKLWLSSIQETGGRVELEGVSINNEVIATFMQRLDESPYMSDVFLVSIEAEDEGELRLKRFQLTAKLVVPSREELREHLKQVGAAGGSSGGEE